MNDARASDLGHAPGATVVMPDVAAPSAPDGREDTAGAIDGSGVDALPVVQLDGFSGPLDLLLDLARRHAIDLATISIRALVDQFVTALEQARHDIPLECRADWLVTASWFALLKSQLLLADDKVAAAAQQEAAATRERLLEKARMQAAAAWLSARRPQLGVDVFACGRPEIFARQHTGDVIGLLRACLWLVRRPVDPPPVPHRPRQWWRPPEALARIQSMLSERREGGDLLQFLPPGLVASSTVAATADTDETECDDGVPLRAAIASTLIAALELARRGTAACEQARRFGPITVQAVTGGAE